VKKVDYIDYFWSCYSFNISWIVTGKPAQSASEDKEIAAPVLTTKATSSEDAGQQFFITNKMRNVLEEELGFLLNEVDEMHTAVKKNNEVSKFWIFDVC
jgi:hypothetical protein